MSTGIGLGLLAALVGVLYAAGCIRAVLAMSEGPSALGPIHAAIREGARAFLRTQYSVIALVGAGLALALALVPAFGPLTALGFVLGGLSSAAAGAVGMMAAVRANVRTTAAAADEGIGKALAVSLRAGSVTGFLVAALALAAVSGFYLLLAALAHGRAPGLGPLVGLAFGASLISIFARLGGGIFTKAADMGADLVGKIEQGIPEDDPRNPAVIADNVGDNVGDCAGMAADVFESYVVTLVSAMLVARTALPAVPRALDYPIALGAAGLVASVLGMQAARIGRGGSVLGAIGRGALLTVVLAAGGFLAVSVLYMDSLRLFGASLVGLAVALGLGAVTAYFTGARFPPTARIVRASRSGHATNVVAGLAVGLESLTLPALLIAGGILAAYAFADLYGIAVATCAMLALTPMVVSIDAYGPVTDNAGGIAEMGHLPVSVRKITDALDAAGNTTKAVTKSFAIGSAGLAALVLFAAFRAELSARGHAVDFSIDSPASLAGLFVGALLPLVFSGVILDAVAEAAARVVTSVRAQLEEHPDILEGTRAPDYGRTVTELTRHAIRKMLLPGLIPVLVPIVLVLAWRPLGPRHGLAQMIGGLLIGAIVTGLFQAIAMCTGGAAWDNAKKRIEAGAEGGKGSPAHQAAVTGDTVGDPYKDAAGPAINPMIKILNLVALLLVPFL